jgi:hypothetical protein
MEYRESVTGESGVSRFMGVIGEASMEDWISSFDFEVDGPMGGE